MYGLHSRTYPEVNKYTADQIIAEFDNTLPSYIDERMQYINHTVEKMPIIDFVIDWRLSDV